MTVTNRLILMIDLYLLIFIVVAWNLLPSQPQVYSPVLLVASMFIAMVPFALIHEFGNR
jgi:hypothetical protein